MKYMLLIYGQEAAMAGMNEKEAGEHMAEWYAFDAEARKKTTVLDGAPLQSVTTATTVRSNGSGSILSDGPFAETKEQLGGYYLIEAKGLDEATAMADMMPNLGLGGSVEVRPLLDM